MAISQVQFQLGLSMIGYLDRYGGEDKGEAALVAAGRVVRHMRQQLSRSIDNVLISPLDFLSLHRNIFVLELLRLGDPLYRRRLFGH